MTRLLKQWLALGLTGGTKGGREALCSFIAIDSYPQSGGFHRYTPQQTSVDRPHLAVELTTATKGHRPPPTRPPLAFGSIDDNIQRHIRRISTETSVFNVSHPYAYTFDSAFSYSTGTKGQNKTTAAGGAGCVPQQKQKNI